jgi:hypothetical protein
VTESTKAKKSGATVAVQVKFEGGEVEDGEEGDGAVTCSVFLLFLSRYVVTKAGPGANRKALLKVGIS